MLQRVLGRASTGRYIGDSGTGEMQKYYNTRDRPLHDGGVDCFGYTTNVSGPTSYTNQIQKVTLYAYDSMSRKTNEIVVGVTTSGFVYNGAGDLLAFINGKNQVTKWDYDQFGRVTNKLDAANNTNFIYQYDLDNRLTNRWTPAKGNTVYSYDNIGNLMTVNYPHSPSIDFDYDGDNRLLSMLDGTGMTSYGYDQTGKLLSEGGLWQNDMVSYTYTNRLRASMTIAALNTTPWTQLYTYDLMRRINDIVSPAGKFGYAYVGGVTYGGGTYYYNNCMAGPLLWQILLPNGALVTNTFDVNVRLLSTALENNNGTTLDSQSYTYNFAGERISETNTLGDYRNYSYDSEGELTSASASEAGGASRLQEQFGYAYDAAGNLNYRTNNALIQTFNVNDLNELTSASRSGTYTVAGTTTIPATNVQVNSTIAALYADTTFAASGFTLANGNNTFTAIAGDIYGRLSTNSGTAYLPATPSYSYDLNGNLLSDGTRSFAYDDENELIGAWVTGAWSNSFAYDGRMRRRIERDYSWSGSSWQETNEIHFIYDGNLVVQERNAANLPQVTYTRGIGLSGTPQDVGGIGGLLARTENSKRVISDQFATTFYHADGNGNVTYLIYTNGLQAAKYLYDPYGNTLAKSGFLADANRYRFSSQEWNDNAGLYCYLYRFYDPNLQRWVNRDPYGERGGINLYTYVDNDPINLFDVYGLCSDGIPCEDCPADQYCDCRTTVDAPPSFYDGLNKGQLQAHPCKPFHHPPQTNNPQKAPPCPPPPPPPPPSEPPPPPPVLPPPRSIDINWGPIILCANGKCIAILPYVPNSGPKFPGF